MRFSSVQYNIQNKNTYWHFSAFTVVVDLNVLEFRWFASGIVFIAQTAGTMYFTIGRPRFIETGANLATWIGLFGTFWHTNTNAYIIFWFAHEASTAMNIFAWVNWKIVNSRTSSCCSIWARQQSISAILSNGALFVCLANSAAISAATSFSLARSLACEQMEIQIQQFRSKNYSVRINAYDKFFLDFAYNCFVVQQFVWCNVIGDIKFSFSLGRQTNQLICMDSNAFSSERFTSSATTNDTRNKNPNSWTSRHCIFILWN